MRSQNEEVVNFRLSRRYAASPRHLNEARKLRAIYIRRITVRWFAKMFRYSREQLLRRVRRFAFYCRTHLARDERYESR